MPTRMNPTISSGAAIDCFNFRAVFRRRGIEPKLGTKVGYGVNFMFRHWADLHLTSVNEAACAGSGAKTPEPVHLAVWP